MGISWEQELRDTVNRNNNDFADDPADAPPVRVDSLCRSPGSTSRSPQHQKPRNDPPTAR